MCGCNGFQGGGGGGSGNLSGTLTGGVLPVASGLHTLIDSVVSESADGIVVQGNIEARQSDDAPSRIDQANDGQGPQVYLIGARGNLGALAAVVDEFQITALRAFAYGGATYVNSAAMRFVVTGAPVAGQVPTRVELLTMDDAGALRVGLVQNPDASITSTECLRIEKTTQNRYETLSVAAGQIDIDAALSDWFDVEITAAAEFQQPTNPIPGGKMKIRIRLNGSLGLNPTFVSDYRFPSDAAPVFVDSASTYYMDFVYNEVDTCWDCVSGPVGPFGGS
jgi:hypothetical protein